MDKKQKARRAPGKDDASPIVKECAACGAPIRWGDKCGSVLVPVGFNFEGRLLAEKLPVCLKCLAIADKGEESARVVEEAIRLRYDAQGESGETEHLDKGAFH